MNRAEYATTAPPDYATFGSELSETDNEAPFRVFKFLTPKKFSFRRTFPFSGGSVRYPLPLVPNNSRIIFIWCCGKHPKSLKHPFIGCKHSYDFH